MAIDVQTLKTWPFGEIEQTYSERDSALYALCLGYGADPMDERALRYVYGPDLQAAPSMASVFGFPGQWMRDPRSGIDWVQVVHGEQRTRLHQALPAAATVLARTRVKSVVDKGPGKGRTRADVARHMRRGQRCVARHCGAAEFLPRRWWLQATGQPSDEAPAPPPPMPQREAD